MKKSKLNSDSISKIDLTKRMEYNKKMSLLQDKLLARRTEVDGLGEESLLFLIL
jgi:hypothetical protein